MWKRSLNFCTSIGKHIGTCQHQRLGWVSGSCKPCSSTHISSYCGGEAWGEVLINKTSCEQSSQDKATRRYVVPSLSTTQCRMPFCTSFTNIWKLWQNTKDEYISHRRIFVGPHNIVFGGNEGIHWIVGTLVDTLSKTWISNCGHSSTAVLLSAIMNEGRSVRMDRWCLSFKVVVRKTSGRGLDRLLLSFHSFISLSYLLLMTSASSR